MRSADYLIDIGPDAGRLGGEVVFEGDMASVVAKSKDEQPTLNAELLKEYPRSYTIKYLTGAETIPPFRPVDGRGIWPSAFAELG